MTTLTPGSTAFVFPGQGSQTVGMAKELAEAFASSRLAFEEADDALGFPLSQLCWEGPDVELNDTINTQPALLAASIAALRAVQAHLGVGFVPAYVAGHSVGEVTALVASGALAYADGLRLIRRRGEAMKAAGAQAPGGMAAILGLDAEALQVICAEASVEAGLPVQVANDNCPGQVVISGALPALEKAMELAKARGAKRALRLQVSIAAHSALMEPEVAGYAAAVAATPILTPLVPVVGNITAAPLPDVDAIRRELPAQLTSPVRWTESVRYLIGQGVSTFVEVGSKDVLTNLLKRIDGNVAGIAVGTPDGVKALSLA